MVCLNKDVWPSSCNTSIPGSEFQNSDRFVDIDEYNGSKCLALFVKFQYRLLLLSIAVECSD